ncbi:MAG: hypothetical protein R6U32_03635 [Candidatus Woesearchaeota archaeon]
MIGKMKARISAGFDDVLMLMETLKPLLFCFSKKRSGGFTGFGRIITIILVLLTLLLFGGALYLKWTPSGERVAGCVTDTIGPFA